MPFAAGGNADFVARLAGEGMRQTVGQPFVVDNRAGAGANLGAEIAAKSPPDGYSVFMATPAHTINASFYSGLSYDLLRDFAPITLVTTGQYMIVVHPALPVRSVKDLVALARAKPGRLAYSSGGRGNATHLAG
ncbi:MAG: tripartite tricarboxylate transporter substrate binding protein, partial [Alphaproteobacteria bacterium]|nr:tripartite tricarboxylate transporter substrate binding protein [Alphaproteobacteria bacterium]